MLDETTAQIGECVLKRNPDQAGTTTADRGSNRDELRRNLEERCNRSVIKHREFSLLDAAHKRLDDETYHHRSVVESGIRSLKQRFDDTLQARTWFDLSRELALKSAEKY